MSPAAMGLRRCLAMVALLQCSLRVGGSVSCVTEYFDNDDMWAKASPHTIDPSEDPPKTLSGEPRTLHRSLKRDKCTLDYEQDCVTYKEVTDEEVSAEMVSNAAKPKSNVLIVKMGAMSPFAGARAENLRRLVRDVGVADSTTQLVFLIDSTSFEKEGVAATKALPALYAPLIVPYTKAAVEAAFPTLPIPAASKIGKPMVRAMTKYYEVCSWTFWWHKYGREHTERLWVIEDDTVFIGNYEQMMRTLADGLPKDSDLITFKDLSLIPPNWVWARQMHEGFDDLTVVGESIMTWMTFYGISKKFLTRLTEMQLEGVTGHIEWFPSTIALREGFRITYVAHPTRGTLKYHGSVGSTFTYCCGAYTADAEGWYEGWKTAEGGFCAPPLLLHPLKADTCTRFSPLGWGKGCYKRKVEGGEVTDFKEGAGAGEGNFHVYQVCENPKAEKCL